MEKIKFGNIRGLDGIVYKICPKCREEISPEMEYAYNREWCPYCGLNLDIVKKEDIIESFKYHIGQRIEGVGRVKNHSKYTNKIVYLIELENTNKCVCMSEEEIDKQIES